MIPEKGKTVLDVLTFLFEFQYTQQNRGFLFKVID